MRRNKLAVAIRLALVNRRRVAAWLPEIPVELAAE